MRPTSGDFESREGHRPYIADYLLHLPDAVDDAAGVPGLEIYRAIAAHCAAHVVETRRPICADALDPLQVALVSLIEDARVEALAIRRFPGLQLLWSRLHFATPQMSTSIGGHLDRLARSLLDPAYRDDDPWIGEGRALFGAAAERLDDNRISREIGVALAQRLAQKKIPFDPRCDLQSAPYRDDNRYFWQFREFDPVRAAAAGYATLRQVRRTVNVMEMVNEVDVETAGDDAQEVWVLASELFPYEDRGTSYNELEGQEPLPDPYHYAEWDYQIQLERPLWTTVVEKRARPGDLQVVADIAARYRREIQRMRFVLDALQPQGVQRIRKLEDGDEIDLDASIAGLTDIRLGHQPDPRIMMRSVRRTRDLSILVLLDLSESTNERVHAQKCSVLDLTRRACVLLADAINKVGDPFAIHGFCSDGRHEVAYYRFKDFAESWDDQPKARLAGMIGQLSTRMGAAIRHAGHHLGRQRSAKRLLLVITDGEPADVDVRDPQYLRQDAKKAVEEVARAGVTAFCLSLDPRADAYVSRIFGQRNYLVVDQVERLPERLPQLYAGLTR